MKTKLSVAAGLAAVAFALSSFAEVPDAFLEYVESSGAAYVNTGVRPVPSTFKATVALSVAQLKNSSFFGIKGSGWASDDSIYVYYGSSTFRLDWIGSQKTTFTPALGTVYRFDCRGNTVSIDGSVYAGSQTKSSTASTKEFWLMGVNNNGTTCVPQRLYGAQFYEDGKTLSANYVPCKKGGVAGLWDTISGQILYSSTATALTAGPELSTVSGKTFIGGGDLKWSTAANWLPAGVPTATDEVIIPAGRTVIADSSVAVKTLDVEPGAALSVGCELTKHLSADTFYPTADTGALSLATTGNLVLKGVLAVGGRTNVYDSVSVTVGGDLMVSARARAYLFASYGDTTRKWNEMTWQDFRAGGGTLTVAGKTTLADSAIVYTVCNPKSGLPFVLNLQDLEVGASAKVSSDNLGWGYVDGTAYGKGYVNNGGGAYGGAGGNNNSRTYGYKAAPFYPGSPGKVDHRAGGAVRIAARDIVLDGTITAIASNQGDTTPSGGGIFVTCRDLTLGASALVTARGGDNTGNNSTHKSGSGGRISIITGSPTTASIDNLYQTGSDVDIVDMGNLKDAATSPYPVDSFNVQGGHQTDYSTNPGASGHGKDGTAWIYAARDNTKAFVTIQGAKTIEDSKPHSGTRQIAKGEVTFSNAPYSYDTQVGGLTRFVCSGYVYTTGSSGEQQEGSGASVTLDVQEDMTFSWVYSETPQYLVVVMKPNDAGTTVATETWVDGGTALDLSAEAIDGLKFVGWEGDVAVADRGNSSLSLTVDRPLRVTAVYEKTEGEPSAKTWTGSGDGTSWDDPANWEPAAIPNFTDAVTVPANATVFVKSHAVAGSLDLAAGSFVKIAATGTSVANAWDVQPEITAINFALGLRVAGDLTLTDAKLVLGGFNNFAEDVRLAVGGDLVLNGDSRLVVSARYGAKTRGAKAWTKFTWEDFLAGGASVTVAGDTKVLGTSVVYPSCNSRSGLPVVFSLQDLAIAEEASFNATMRGWTYVSADLTYYGYGHDGTQKGGSYGGLGGGSPAASKVYGYPNAPFMPGSPGGFAGYSPGAGGGAVRIDAKDIALDGKIYADGVQSGGDSQMDGSGGSVFITCRKLTPGAKSGLYARGGINAGNTSTGKCGGGGRIVVITGEPDTEMIANLYATGTDAEKLIPVTDDPAVANADPAQYPAISVIGGHGASYDTNPTANWHGRDGSFVWARNRGTKVMVTVAANMPTATVDPPNGTDTLDLGDAVFTADEMAVDPEYPTIGRYFVQGVNWSNAVDGVTHFVAGSEVKLSIEADTWVDWVWGKHEYYVEVASVGEGATDGTGWHAAGSVLALTAQPAAGSDFAFWAGDVDEADRKKPSISVTMDGPKRIRAVYSRVEAVAAVWKGAAKGDWFDVENWENGLVPTAADDVTMTNGTAFVRDSAELEMASLTLSGAAKLYIGGTGAISRTSWPFDADATNTWKLTVAGDIVITNGAQLVMGGHHGLAESELTAANLTLVKGGQLAMYAGERGDLSELDTFRTGGARVKVAGALNITGSSSTLMVFNHYKSGAPVVVTARTFALENGAVIDADYNGWGRWERTLASGTWSPVVYGLGVSGNHADAGGRAGASYGGKGGLAEASKVYGFEAAPFYPGSPMRDMSTGTHLEFGGGSICLHIADKAYVDATIRSRGRTPYDNGDVGGSSGGSIWLTARKVKFGPNAKLDVSGGAGGGYKNSSGGGGGRIAVGVRLDSAKIQALYETGTFKNATVSPLADHAEDYPVSVNVAGGNGQNKDEGAQDGGRGSAVLVKGPTPGLMLIVR